MSLGVLALVKPGQPQCIRVPIGHFFKKWANSGLFLIYFRLFKHTLQFLQQINVNKCPSSIRCQDSNSRPLKHEYSPMPTRPGLPPIGLNI